MKTFTITTTNMRKIIVQATSYEEAESIASTQFKDGEVVMMIATESNTL